MDRRQRVMKASLSLIELLRTALAESAVGLTFCSGLHPVIYSANGVATYGSLPAASQDIEEILRRLMSSREMRQYRATGVVHFRCVFERVSLLGGAKIDGGRVRVELRRMAA